MTYPEFQIALIKLNLTIRELAKILNMNPNSISNYKVKGNVPNHISIILKLMLEMKKHDVSYLSAIN